MNELKLFWTSSPNHEMSPTFWHAEKNSSTTPSRLRSYGQSLTGFHLTNR